MQFRCWKLPYLGFFSQSLKRPFLLSKFKDKLLDWIPSVGYFEYFMNSLHGGNQTLPLNEHMICYQGLILPYYSNGYSWSVALHAENLSLLVCLGKTDVPFIWSFVKYATSPIPTSLYQRHPPPLPLLR